MLLEEQTTQNICSLAHSSWQGFLHNKETLVTLREIFAELKPDLSACLPPPDACLRFLRTDLSAAKVLILGQDPYPQPGAATGRCFEVGNLLSWSQKFRNVSLKNIVRAIYAAENNEIIAYRQIIERIGSSWSIMPPSSLFGDWEAQGVLLLNSSFTCLAGQPGSHAQLWARFADILMDYISDTRPDLIWFIWGSHALNRTKRISIASKLVSQHPMMCYPGPERHTDFLYGKLNMFKETWGLINWSGTTR
jgi:uracil-DNA glycosylase